jgi:citronellyl-CoA dehydrogenase
MSSLAPLSTAAEYPYFSHEHYLIRQTVKRFCLEEIAPHSAEWEEQGGFPVELFRKAAAVGLFGIRIDPEWGGTGQDWWATASYIEAMSYGDSAPITMNFLVQSDLTLPVIQELGTTEQKAEFLRPAVAGEKIAALGISEPGGGSDVAALKTRARMDGGDFVISGQKLWITNGLTADFIVLGVRTGEEGHKGISLVLFPTDTKGFSTGRKLKKVGNRASDTAELFFDECRIPRRYLLGELNRGFYYIVHNFQGERLALALFTLAQMERTLEQAIQYGRERYAFGKPLLANQVWRHRFAEHLTSVEAAKWLVYRAVDLMNRGVSCQREVTMAKLFTTELAQKVAYDCMQIFGGFGYTTEYPVGRFWRDIRLHTVGGGAAEIMKEILAKEYKF